jgi:Tfp pilus assembly protein PilF
MPSSPSKSLLATYRHCCRPVRPIAAALGVLALLSPVAGAATPPAPPSAAPAATVREFQREFTTYPFSDPNPIPVMGRVYPYFRFDGFAKTSERRRWKVVELENAYLRVQILPEIGGKIWNAIEKKSGRSFLYDNEVVKFRDVALRGPWTSGGIEANYGIIGHTPNVSTPVDYTTRTNPDGSVSCIIGAHDLLTRTPWRLEVRLGANDAMFTTTSSWINSSPLEQPYYSWMNAAIPVTGKLQFLYPGTKHLGHAGEHAPWPIDAQGRDLSWYDNNDFGGYKSYHVFGKESEYFGAYWHANDFGMIRWSSRDDKAGKKLWIWGLSRQGMIWEQLLTDRNGQYAEVQSGRLFNQSAEASTFTPFKHRGFAPGTVDRWTEAWYPVVGTKGVVAASSVGALNATRVGDRLAIMFSPVVPVADSLRVNSGSRRIASRFVQRAPLALYVDTIPLGSAPLDSLIVVLGDERLVWRANDAASNLARPVDAPASFDWRSAYGYWMQGKEWMRQRDYASARPFLDSALAKDANYVPALTDRAQLAIRAGEYEAARGFAQRALAVDTYDAAANYHYALANRALGRDADARDGFELAAQSPEWRPAAWLGLARLQATAGAMTRAREYTSKVLALEPQHGDALAMGVVLARRAGDAAARDAYLAQLDRVDPLSHFARFERALATNGADAEAVLRTGVRSELPEQTLLELASWYVDAGDRQTALRVLRSIGDHPEALYWRAVLEPGDAATLVAKANALPATRVFPFRPELVPALQQAARLGGSWKPAYYLALTWWSMGRSRAADSLFAVLGNAPDFAPFYGARASLPARPTWLVRQDLTRAAALDSSEWRYARLRIERALADGDALTAVAHGVRATRRFPANESLALLRAKAHVTAAQFAAAAQILDTLVMLPAEGAKDARAVYHEAQLGLARAAIAQSRWDDATRHVRAAREWPERLGAGKPYAADVDETVEDSLDLVIARRITAGSGTSARAVRPADTLRYGTGEWEADSLGNHRAVVQVDAAGDAVLVRIPWRRRDRTPEQIDAIVMVGEGREARRIANVQRRSITREQGELIFQAPATGTYHVYYLPYTGTFKSNYPKITYRAVEATADPEWLARVSGARSLPEARVTGFDAINRFTAFTAMEYIATRSELAALLTRHAGAPFLAFAEDRSRSIRMTDDIPQGWAARGAFQPFRGTARRGEYYPFQIGVWAYAGRVDSVRYTATPLRSASGAVIPAAAITAFNLEGTDWSGQRFTRTITVDSGKVQALWFGVDVPAAAAPGRYDGQVTITSVQGRRSIPVSITVTAERAVAHGDDVPDDLTRLRWLNSQLAADDSVAKPYTPLVLKGRTIALLGRDFTFGTDGMPAQIRSFFAPNNTSIGTTSRDILAAPVRLAVKDAAGQPLDWNGAAPAVTKQAPGAVAWRAKRSAGALSLDTRAQLEFDGTVEYVVTLRASAATSLADVALEIPMQASAARYMMGLGQKGGYRPDTFRWTWDVAKKNQDAAWIGDVNAGLQFTLRDEQYVRPLNTNFYLSKPLVEPRSWANGGKGGCDIARNGSEQVLVRCYSGAHRLAAGDSLRFDFRLMITPFKPLDVQGQWATRFFHAFVPVDSAAKRGANTLNVHHANRVNPWINYPFIETAQMKAYIDSAHAKGLKTKIYYTVRELTNHAPELFALRSLGDEVLSHGPGGGYSWLQEHLGSDYIAAWHVPTIKDAAVVNSGVSRWHNFYIEGLDWLVKHQAIDGLYLDDVAFDRLTMKRIRKTLDRGNTGALLDLHSANQYNPRDGFASSANLYLEHFPYINRLWFGEYFDYDSKPDYWLVELSGIPFGLMGEMLEKGGNPWRGLTMGMTARLPWSGDPAPIWRLWDQFGIQQSTMHGWWSGRDPVRTSDADVLATTWSKTTDAGPVKAMISLGNWRATDAPVTLTVDWGALGLDPARVRLRAPAVQAFQEGAVWAPGDRITVPGGKGLVLLVEQR